MFEAVIGFYKPWSDARPKMAEKVWKPNSGVVSTILYLMHIVETTSGLILDGRGFWKL